MNLGVLIGGMGAGICVAGASYELPEPMYFLALALGFIGMAMAWAADRG